ncbi:glycosyl hydrolase [Aureococcus anophagefferens]|nr:glycosyl hydrolase [Aureococcus anophagefferens]
MRSRVRAALAGILGLLALAHVSIYRAVREFVTVLGTKGAPGDYAMAVESALRIPDAASPACTRTSTSTSPTSPRPRRTSPLRRRGLPASGPSSGGPGTPPEAASSAPCATSPTPSCVDDDDFLGAVAYDPFQWMYEAGAVYVYGTAVDCGALRDDVFGRMFFNNAAAGADAAAAPRSSGRSAAPRTRRGAIARPNARRGGRRGRAARGADASRAQVMATRTAFWFEAPLERLLWEIDRTGSIYVHRWGDAPIQTAAALVQLLLLRPGARERGASEDRSVFSAADVLDGRAARLYAPRASASASAAGAPRGRRRGLSPVVLPPAGAGWREAWRYNSGYHRAGGAAAARFAGLGHTALSGTGLNAGGDFLLTPCDGVGALVHATEDAAGAYAATLVCAGGRGGRGTQRSRSGYPGVIVLADAVLKNVTNFGRGARPDGVPERALRQMARTGAAEPHVNASTWIPAGRAKAVSHALEVAVADACASRVAARLGDARLAATSRRAPQAALDRIAALYTARDDGLPGNDDVGQTSAWFVWASLGLYPVDPCGDHYELSRPLFADVSVDTGAGRTLRIVVRNAGLPYVRAAFWGETARVDAPRPRFQ